MCVGEGECVSVWRWERKVWFCVWVCIMVYCFCNCLMLQFLWNKKNMYIHIDSNSIVSLNICRIDVTTKPIQVSHPLCVHVVLPVFTPAIAQRCFVSCYWSIICLRGGYAGVPQLLLGCTQCIESFCWPLLAAVDAAHDILLLHIFALRWQNGFLTLTPSHVQIF